MNKSYKRLLDLNQLLLKKSYFLFGPRATGKTFLIHSSLGENTFVIDLLKQQFYLELSARPYMLEQLIDSEKRKNPNLSIVVIDEIQKIPTLLNEVHRLIEESSLHFLLTGSSARKLLVGNANLLAGRARRADMFPLVQKEIPNFDLNRYLLYGGLPAIYTSDEPEEDLDAYVSTYLKEEILQEGFVRNLLPFSRFLLQASLSNGDILNFSKIGNDAQIPPSTVREYFHILEDTLLGTLVPAWTQSKKRKAISTAKFYFFDCGVAHFFAGIKRLDPGTYHYGKAFEQWIGMEIKAANSYLRAKKTISFWRSIQHDEVDFIIGNDVAIEVKSSLHVNERHAKALKKLKEEGLLKEYLLVSQDVVEKSVNDIHCIHWRTFLERLWDGHYFYD